jgi:hypothetical protein
MSIEELREETKESCNINIRLPKEEKVYYEYWLRYFTKEVIKNNSNIKRVAFGKQDIRGTESITFFDERHCVPYQKHFNNKFELLGFVCGVVRQDYKIKEYLEVKE